MKAFGTFSPCALFLVMITTMTGATQWRKIEWRGEPAWASETEQCRAVVSETRGRLVHFGPAGLDLNLLNEVAQIEPYREGADSPNWGGHRFWLGPQKTWVWPPNPDWEFSAARLVKLQGERLVLNMPDSVDDFPGLVREYFWDGDRLGCRVSWTGTELPFYGMHIFVVPATTRPVVRPIPTGAVAHGLVVVTFDQPECPTQRPPGTRMNEDGFLELNPAAESIKLGFAPQVLTGAGEGWSLVVSPAETKGQTSYSPDAGFLTQAWICQEGGDFIELEQISPYLVPEEGGTASSLVFLSLQSRMKEP